MMALMPLLFRLGILPRPPVASTIVAAEPGTSIVIRPDSDAQIELNRHPVRRHRNVVFASPASANGKRIKLRMDVIAPQAEAPRPGVVYVTGGGFIVSPKEGALDLRTYVAEAGFVVASIQYRTIRNEATFRDGIADVKAAVRFLRAHAADYGIDPRKMAVWGESAGGYLAAMAGLTNGASSFDTPEHAEHSSDVQAVIDKFGATDVSKIGDDFDAKTRAELVGGDNLIRYFGARADAPGLDLPLASTIANPITYISSSAPPFLLMHGSRDHMVSPSQTSILHEALRAAGVPSTRYVLEGADHGDLAFLGDKEAGRAWSSRETMGLIVDFLKQTIGP